MTETGTYNPMYSRPYQTQMDGRTLGHIQELTHGLRTITAAGIAGIAGQIIRPSGAPEGAIQIPNGWDTKRLRFMMVVEVAQQFGSSIQEIITGYTDFPGYTQSGALSPDMRLIINNLLTMRTVTQQTAHGMVPVQTLTNVSHLLSANLYLPPATHYSAPQTAGLFSLTPQDVAYQLASQHLDADMTSRDYRSTFTSNNGLKKSRRSNNVASQHLARSITGIRQAMLDSESIIGNDFETISEVSVQNVREDLVNKDSFIEYLTTRSDFAHTKSVSIAELDAMFHGASQNCVVHLPGPVQRIAAPAAGQTTYWHESTMEVQIATILMQTLPALMFDSMIASAVILMTNRTIDNNVQLDLDNVRFLIQDYMGEQTIPLFQQRLVQEVMNDLTQNGLYELMIKANANVIGDTYLSISFMGQPEVTFTIPSFSDALTSPVVTCNLANLTAMTNEIEQIATPQAMFNDMVAPQAPTAPASNVLSRY